MQEGCLSEGLGGINWELEGRLKKFKPDISTNPSHGPRSPSSQEEEFCPGFLGQG